jgi:hypothetical protein
MKLLKKIAIGFGIFLVLVVAAAIVVPLFLKMTSKRQLIKRLPNQ